VAKNTGKVREKRKKKTSIGNSKFTKRGHPGPHGGNKDYKKKYRGQGK
jgi:hypothetical protein